MNSLGILFALIATTLMLALPRRYAIVPLFMGVIYVTVGQVIEVGPFHFTIVRLLLAVGVVRVVLRGERISGGLNRLDKLMILWAIWGVCSCVFHKKPASHMVYMLGIAYTGLGSYFLIRIFVRDMEEFFSVIKILLIMLAPVALEMVYEKMTSRNLFSAFGYITEASNVRHGKIRAQGAFAHAILAGTVGAGCLPLAVLLWNRHRRLALLGFAVSAIMILSSASSGPILTTLVLLAGLCVWKVRRQLRLLIWGGILALVALDLLMNDPVYYLMARIDLTGSSTGWHRATLIRSCIEHFNEWWLAGTDYTRHWMQTGVPWSQDHTDITNHYIRMGVWGGLPLMLLFMGILYTAFMRLSWALRNNADAPLKAQFAIWVLGTILFGHCVTFLSICYFDHSVVFLYFLLATIGSLQVTRWETVPVQAPEEDLAWKTPEYESNLCHHC